MAKVGFTMLELVIVIVIVGILVTLAMVNYTQVRTDTFDKEAKANLKLIQAAQKIYNMENGFYYPYSATADTTGINTNLRLSIPTPTSPNWNYNATGGSIGCGKATSAGSINTPVNRYWYLNTSDTGNPTPLPDNGCSS